MGPDSRRYLGRLSRNVYAALQGANGLSPNEREELVLGLLRAFIDMCLEYAVLECVRNQKGPRNRYAYHQDCLTIYLWMPREIPGHDRRRWIEDHAGPIDLTRPGEQERVQAVIDREAPYRRVISLSDLEYLPEDRRSHSVEGSSFAEEHLSASDMIDVFVRELVPAIIEQRPAIRGLGEESYAQLLRYTFEDKVQGTHSARTVAIGLGLTRSTRTRFDGSKTPKNGIARDLPRNVAAVIWQNGDLRVAAKAAGVWGYVCKALRKPDEPRER